MPWIVPGDESVSIVPCYGGSGQEAFPLVPKPTGLSSGRGQYHPKARGEPVWTGTTPLGGRGSIAEKSIAASLFGKERSRPLPRRSDF